MKRPVIGVTPAISGEDTGTIMINNGMLDAVWAVGGLPVLLPLTEDRQELEQLLDTVNGVLFSGGGDIDPLVFGECQHLQIGTVTPKRDAMELPLVRMAVQRGNIAVFGICRGFQVLNVALGGDVYQDIPSEYPGHPILHRQKNASCYPSHPVSIREDSRLAEIVGEPSILVNSLHHQAVRKPGRGMTVTAHAPDGVVEASELAGHPFCMGVQWHPERMWMTDRPSRKLFEAFIEAAAAMGEK